MNLQDKYPTLEQSKRIAELLGEGAPESEKVWSYWHGNGEYTILIIADSITNIGQVPAYDLAELGEMLYKEDSCYLESIMHGDQGLYFIRCDGEESEWYDTESQARAALLIHLLETP